jgi:hypothetical protein
VYIALLCFEAFFIYFFYLRDVGKDPEELTFLFKSENQNRETLAASTAKVIGQDEIVTKVSEAPVKKA